MFAELCVFDIIRRLLANDKKMEVSNAFLVLVPVVIGVTEVIKRAVERAGFSSRFAPATSLILGVIGATVFIGGMNGPSVLQGVLVGLTASGLYSGVKATVGSK